MMGTYVTHFFRITGISIRSSIVPYMINNNKTAADRDTHARLASRVVSQVARELGTHAKLEPRVVSLVARELGMQQGVLTGVAFGVAAGAFRPYIHQFMTGTPLEACECVRSGYDQGMRQFIEGMDWPSLINSQLFIENSQIWLEQSCNGDTNTKPWVMDSTVVMTINAATHKLTNYGILALVKSPLKLPGLIAVELSDIVIMTVIYDSDLTIAQKTLTLCSGIATTTLTSFTVATGLLAVGAGLASTIGAYCSFKGVDKCTRQAIEIAEASYDTIQHIYERTNEFTKTIGDHFQNTDCFS